MASKPLSSHDPRVYAPFDDHTQPKGVVDGYRNTERRWPSKAPYPLPVGTGELTGPSFAHLSLEPGQVDLAKGEEPGTRAMGQLIEISGRVLDEDGHAISGCFVEIWHANAAGKYAHPNDTTDNPLDQHFRGHGRTRTDEDGHYRFRTIKPGAYPTPETGNWWRPPHIHFSLFGDNLLQRLVTQMYFPGEPLNAHDRILNSIPDRDARERLIAALDHSSHGSNEYLSYTLELVLRGRRDTPFDNRGGAA